MKLSRVGNYLWTTSPRDVLRRVAGREEKAVPVAPWNQGKHAKWGRLVYYLDTFRRLAERHGHSLGFEERRVLEVGAGPVLGVGPLVLIEGAKSFMVLDPAYQELREAPGFEQEFLYPLFAMYSASHGDERTRDWNEFLSLVEAIETSEAPLEEADVPDEHFDVVLSKSCLEHIADLDGAAAASARMSSSGSLHFHYVDFSMHHARDRSGSPFGETYRTAKADNPEYFGNVRGLVNLLRASEVRGIFEKHFSEVHFHPLMRLRTPPDPSTLHADWRGYDAGDLSVVNGVLFAVKS